MKDIHQKLWLAVLVFVALTLCSLPDRSLAALSWQDANGFVPVSVNSYAVHPTDPLSVYAGTELGVIKTGNGGNSWTVVNTGLPADIYVTALAIDKVTPQTVYAGTDSGMFKSVDGGGSWTAINSGLPANAWIMALAINPTSPLVLYAATDSGGIFKSTNGGGSWTAANTGLTDTFVTCLAIDPVLPDYLYAGTLSGVFKSSNGAGSWALTANTSSISSLAINPATHTAATAIIYAGTYMAGVYKSINSGGAWTSTGMSSDNMVNSLAVNSATPTMVYAATDNGIYRTTDSGTNWSPMNTGLTDLYSPSLAIYSPGNTTTTKLLIGTSTGIFRSVNAGSLWSSVTKFASDSPILSLAMNGSTLFAGTAAEGIIRSLDGGGSWNVVNSSAMDSTLLSYGVKAISISLSSPLTVYAGFNGSSTSTSTGGLFRSTDGGATWSGNLATMSYKNIYALAVHPTNSLTLFAGTKAGGVYRSTDGGTNWLGVNTNLPGASSNTSARTAITAMAMDPLTPSTLYVAAYNTLTPTILGVYKTVNGADTTPTWSAVNTGLTNLNVNALAIDPVTTTTLYAGTGSGTVFKSIDSGANWTSVSTGLGTDPITALAIDPVNRQTLYATTAVGVYKTSDSGANWQMADVGEAIVNAASLVLDPANNQRLYAGTGLGVYLGQQETFQTVALDAALDATDVQWTTYGDAAWFGQTSTSHDGVDAAQNGELIDGQSSYLETTITGPATLSFWWKVSSELGGDFLSFRLDGVQVPAVPDISGEEDWVQITGVTIPAGPHVISWAYAKDGGFKSGFDRGWVDQVILESTNKTLSVTLAGAGTGTVVINPPGTNCTGGTCQEIYDAGSSVTLTVVPSDTSTFTGWSGDTTCTTESPCAVIMDSNRSVTATLALKPPRIKLENALTTFYLLGDAVSAAQTGEKLSLQQTDFIGNLYLATDKALTLKGGYDAAFTNRAGYSAVDGVVTIGLGSVVMDMITIK